MKVVSLEGTTLTLSELVEMAKGDAVILTRDGQPLVAVRDVSGSDWESTSLSQNSRFRALIEQSRRSYRDRGGIGLEQLLNIGLTMYDAMAGRRNIKWHQRLKREDVLKLAPALVSDGLKDGFTYYDGQTNDARLTMAFIKPSAAA